MTATPFDVALQESEDRYRALFTGMTEGFALHELMVDEAGRPVDWRFLDVNPAFERLTGLERQRVVGRTHNEVLPGDDPKWLQFYGQVALTGQPVQFENYSPSLKRHYEVFAYRPAPMQFAVIFMDITERKRAEEALRESEARYHELFKNMAEEVHLWKLVRDDQGRIQTWTLVDANPPALKTWGRSSVEEIRGLTTDEIFGAGSTEHYLPVVQKVMSEGVPCSFEDFFPALDRHFRFTTVPLGDCFITTGADITVIKKTQGALQESERRFRLALENSPVSVAIQDCNLVYQWAYNQRTGRPEQIVGRSDADLFAPEDVTRISQDKRRVVESGAQVHTQHWVTGNGRRMFLDLHYEPLRGPDGDIAGIGIAAVDLTAQKQAEEELRASENRSRLLAETMLQGVVHQAADGTILAMNPAAERILGKTRADFLGSTSVREEHDTIREDGQPFPGTEHPSMVALRTGQSVRGVVMGVFNPMLSQYRWIQIDAVPVLLPDQDGLSEVYTVFEDITSRKRAEEALAASEARYRGLAESIPAMLWAADAHGVTIDHNIRWQEYTGQVVSHEHSDYWTDVLHPDDVTRVVERWRQCCRTGEDFAIEYRIRRAADGAYRWHSVQAMLRKDEQGRPLGWFGTCLDIEALKRTEDKLQRAAAMLEAIGNSTPDAIFVKDREGRMLSANPATVCAVDRTSEEILGRLDSEWHPNPDQAAAIMANDRRVMESGKTLVTEELFTDAQGPHVWLSTKSPLLDANGQVVGLVGVSRDITDRHRAEKAVREAKEQLELRVRERTAELREAYDTLERRVAERTLELTRSNQDLEQFAYVSSHDLQEPLRMVSNFSELLAEELEGQVDVQAHQYLRFIRDGALRMQALVRDLLAYSRVSVRTDSFQVVDLDAVLDSALADLRVGLAESDAEVLRDPLPRVSGDATMLGQLLLNLLGNAIKFRRADVAPRIQVGARLEEGRWTCWVRDNGIGIPQRYHEQIFRIFQRLHERETYPGTGIGLAVCRRIVERHGGRIWVASTPGEETTLFFTLPEAPATIPVP